jgi:hypothetical protein
MLTANRPRSYFARRVCWCVSRLLSYGEYVLPLVAAHVCVHDIGCEPVRRHCSALDRVEAVCTFASGSRLFVTDPCMPWSLLSSHSTIERRRYTSEHTARPVRDGNAATLHAVSVGVSDDCSAMADTALPLVAEHVCVHDIGCESVCRHCSALDRVDAVCTFASGSRLLVTDPCVPWSLLSSHSTIERQRYTSEHTARPVRDGHAAIVARRVCRCV